MQKKILSTYFDNLLSQQKLNAADVLSGDRGEHSSRFFGQTTIDVVVAAADDFVFIINQLAIL
jgi:major membrane immunogen (membrane-anchored lipoprotein)